MNEPPMDVEQTAQIMRRAAWSAVNAATDPCELVMAEHYPDLLPSYRTLRRLSEKMRRSQQG